VLLALGTAILLNRGISGLPLYRTIYYVPTIVPIVATAVLWKWIFNPNFGLLNAGLDLVGLPKIPWLGSLEWAMPAIIIMSWWSFGVSMVVLLAGLQGVPDHLLEAARIDGANRWHEFRHVVVPMISPVLFFVFIVQVIGSFQVFTPTYLMTDGGPGNATLTLVLYLYRNGFMYFQMGYASAIAWALTVIVLLATLVQLRVGQAWVYYEGDAKPVDKP
jgi:multiple sugar transport system permease protein